MAIGNAIIELGGGRREVGEHAGPGRRLSRTSRRDRGDVVDGERPLAVVHARSEADADAAELPMPQGRDSRPATRRRRTRLWSVIDVMTG